MLMLTSPALRGEHCTAMHVAEIAVGKLIPVLRALLFFVVNSQMPLGKLLHAIEFDKGIFFLRLRLMFAPVVSFIHYHLSLTHEGFGMVKGSLVKFHGHTLGYYAAHL